MLGAQHRLKLWSDWQFLALQKDEELAHLKETAEERLDKLAEQLRAVCEERDRMDSALQVSY